MTCARSVTACLLAFLILTAIPRIGWAEPGLLEPEMISEAAVLMDADSGQILYAKDPDALMYPASITKILTGYLALKYGNPSDVLTMSGEVVNQVPRSSSHISLLPGETITLEDALYALALVSANDAAIAIAEHISGSVEAFAELMNREAAELGARNSHFVNPNGMPAEEHYTTARDMALITAEALRMPDFITYFGKMSYEIPATNLSEARSLVSKNRYIDGTYACPGLIISKTGWTSSALGTLVTAAEQGNTTLIAVVMKSPILEDKYTDTDSLFQYGFQEFQRVRLSRNLMEDKMRELGMEADCYLSGFAPMDVLLPKSVDMQDISVSVPGGFDAGLGVSTVPVSVDVAGRTGRPLHIADLLLTIAKSDPVSQERTAPEASGAAATKTIHPGAVILLALAAVVAVLGLLSKTKVHN